MRVSPWSCVCWLALGCAHTVQARSVDAPAVTASPTAPRVELAQLAMDDTRVCVVAEGRARCGLITTGEALPLWREAPPAITALALGFRVCALTASGLVCAAGAGEDPVARALPVEGAAGGLARRGVGVARGGARAVAKGAMRSTRIGVAWSSFAT